MSIQPEQILENNLVAQLHSMDYQRVHITSEQDLLDNLQLQLEKHNKLSLSEREFAKVLNHLNKGGVYDRALILRDKMHLVRDDGNSAYLEFLNTRDWCQNIFQVANQIENEGSYKNRYDVTILINGLPLVQIELKRRGLELKEAFNQTNRYQRHSYDANYGLFQYIQLFVISNGVNTKYYANNRNLSFKFTSFWTDKDNKKITQLDEFAKDFLEPCHIAKMISKHIVLTHGKSLMVLRPYQYYAVEAIIDRVENSNLGGYIWHTTGSGKTLTSFKASQILIDNPDIYKVVFVVDRRDLDTQTIREFNDFKEGSVDTTNNTAKLVKQFNGDTRLIVTTIQKLHNAITTDKHALKMDQHKDKKMVFIFDECHRSQFGDTHKRITDYFTNYQLFGFTGTPIFADNASGSVGLKRTTKDLFGECLHKYVITDAIKDDNVLRFSVEYVGKFKQKDTVNEIDIEVEDIDKQELMDSQQRLSKITDYILTHHNTKTKNRGFTAMFCVSSVEVLGKYYQLFKNKQQGAERPLRIATIFSYTTNEEDKDANGLLDEEINLDQTGPVNLHSRDTLENCIQDYNQLYGTNYTTKDSTSFYNYYRDIADRVKKGEVDILLVVNMFLTGFDSKTLSTLYVDKNLRYHGLIQAYSRTNRILNETKPQGNIVVFRNLKKQTDAAVALFSNKDAQEDIFIAPYTDYLEAYTAQEFQLLGLYPTVRDVDMVYDQGEMAMLEFVRQFRELIRLRNILSTFADYDTTDFGMSAQMFEDYKSKYLDLFDQAKGPEKEKVSILNDVDFELELIQRDFITIDYIMGLLGRMIGASADKQAEIKKAVLDTVANDIELRSKRELIEKFINSTMPKLDDADQVQAAFENFWNDERRQAFEQLCQQEGIDKQKLEQLLDRYIFTGRLPRQDDYAGALSQQPKILERQSIIERVTNKFNQFIETFIEGI